MEECHVGQCSWARPGSHMHHSCSLATASHVTLAHGKRGWEMSLASSRFPALTLYCGRGTTHFQWMACCLYPKGVAWQTGSGWAPLLLTLLSMWGLEQCYKPGIEETRMLGVCVCPPWVHHCRESPSAQLDTHIPESEAMRWKSPGVCPFPTQVGNVWARRSSGSFGGAERCLGKK